VWVPVTTSQESLEWAARENAPITPGAVGTLAARQDMVRYYAACLAKNGRTITPDHVITPASVYIAESREQAMKEAGPYMLYFFQTLFSHGNISNVTAQRQHGYVKEDGMSWLRPENREDFLRALQGFRRVTMDDLKRNERLCWGSPGQVRDTLIALAEALGSNTLLIQFNQGAMPHEMFVNQIRRFSTEVLPALRKHTVTNVVAA
jgi:alkanesulfonate monooxygenase SsuD/methylene tetrahydromethanopterin reductase-like flavin-dependent oxidoreductase (luciferase family)